MHIFPDPYGLCQLWHTWRSLDSESLATFDYAVMDLRIDYCKTVLVGAPRTIIDKLQQVLNVAICVVSGT